jgi:hypothetical protein
LCRQERNRELEALTHERLMTAETLENPFERVVELIGGGKDEGTVTDRWVVVVCGVVWCCLLARVAGLRRRGPGGAEGGKDGCMGLWCLWGIGGARTLLRSVWLLTPVCVCLSVRVFLLSCTRRTRFRNILFQLKENGGICRGGLGRSSSVGSDM